MLVKIIASLGLLACIVLAVHMCLSRRQQLRLEAWSRRALNWLSKRAAHTFRPFSARQHRQAARSAALEALDRAKRVSRSADDGGWDGNVYRPKQFEKPRKPH